jgi:hypothetical protein
MIDLVYRTWINFALNENGILPLYDIPSNYSNITTIFDVAGLQLQTDPPEPDSLDSARFLQAMPYVTSFSTFASLESFGQFLYPIAMSLQLAVYVYILVLEKKNKLREMMKSHGLKTRDYYFANYAFFYMIYLISVIVFWGVGAAAKFR